MADKSMFSIEVETATFDHFKHNFDDYHSKLQATLSIWKQISAEINTAASALKGLGIATGGRGGAGGGASGGGTGTSSTISSMTVRATGTVQFTATGTVNFSGGGTAPGGGTPSPAANLLSPQNPQNITNKSLAQLNKTMLSFVKGMQSGGPFGGLMSLIKEHPLLSGAAAVGTFAVTEAMRGAAEVAELRKSGMGYGGIGTGEMRAVRFAGSFMDNPEELLGSAYTASRNLTSVQRRAYQNIYGTQGAQAELNKDPMTAGIEGLNDAVKQLMTMPKEMRETQAENLGYTQTFGLTRMRQWEAMTPAERQQRVDEYHEVQRMTDLTKDQEKALTDANIKMAEANEVIDSTFVKGLAPVATVVANLYWGFAKLLFQMHLPTAAPDQGPYKGLIQPPPTTGPEGDKYKPFVLPFKTPEIVPEEKIPEGAVPEYTGPGQNPKPSPSPHSSALVSPLASYEAGSLGGVAGEVKTTDTEGTKVSKEIAATLKEMRDDQKKANDATGGGGGGGGGDNRGGGGGGGSGPHSPGASGGAGSGGAGAGGKFSTKAAYDLIKAAGGSDEEASTLAAISQAESSGNPGAHNTNAKTGDNSYGLWQINMLGKMGPERLAHFGLKSNEDLFDPATNARVALQMAREKHGYTDWSTYKSGGYQKWMGGEKFGGPSAGGGAGGKVGVDGMNEEFKKRLQAGMAAAEKATGEKAEITSGFRTYAKQLDIYNHPEKYGATKVALPGTSRHEKGLAADLQRNAASAWLTQHAAEFGLGTVGGDPGHFQMADGSGPSPDASAIASPLASDVAMSTSSQGGGFTLPGSGESIHLGGDKPIRVDDGTAITLPTFDVNASPAHHIAAAAHHLAMAHHHHRHGRHHHSRHHHHMARRHLHHMARHHKHALAAVMRNSSIAGPGMGEFQPGDPRNPFGTDRGVPKGYEALKKYLETHKVGTEEWDDSSGSQFKSLSDSVRREGGYDTQFDPVKKQPWGNMNPYKERPGGRYGPLPGKASEQQASASSPLGLHNWQLGQSAAINIHNKTGSDVFIAASTLTA